MSGYEYLITSLAILGSLYASYTDLKEGRIYNICTFPLIWGGVLAQIIYALIGVETVKSALGITLGGGAISFLMFWAGALAPGDAKLIWGLSMILPPSLFEAVPRSTRLSFPPAVLIINILSIYFIFALSLALIKSKRKQKLAAIRSIVSSPSLPRGIGLYILNLLSFLALSSCLFYLFNYLLGIRLGGVGRLAFVIFLYYILNKLADRYLPGGRYAVYALLFPPFVGLLLAFPSLFSSILRSSLIIVGIYLIVSFFLRYFVLSLDWLTLSKPVSIYQLREGMIPAEKIVKVEERGKVVYRKSASSRQANGEVIISPSPEGLSSEEIARLRKLADEGHFKEFGDRIVIQRSLPFAPFILAGLILTVLFKGPFLLKLIELMRGAMR
ncbi:hypothetical protein DRP77_11300 [Candidatus Poribacteria bacterium]|nr:MAG: hypothetical protein DRP77_11300 [Candidatus Poribacteria bacterium]